VKHWLAFTLSSLFLLGYALMGQNGSSKSGAWAGVLVNADCTADEAYAESAKCIEQPAAKLALYDDTLRRIYHLEPQGQAMGHLGEVVTVQGALRNDVIHVASLQVVTEIGLPMGRQAMSKPATRCEGQRERFFCLSVPPIGDLTANSNWSSCKPRNRDLRARASR
jgi:hypothetical protein